MGERKVLATKKISGFSSGFAPKKTGLMSGGLGKKTAGPDFIKGPRQAKGSRGDGMNGGY
ncbi:MAG: hypothetical protein KGL39_34480 [Patescibacteria group bacterium]|nr:hypothetical protein [Patescibacteria group bacterium]